MAQLISAKETGTVGELAFATEAMRRGYKLAQPLGDDSQYDLLLEAGNRVYRVQVKAASYTEDKRNTYTFMLRRGKHKTAYTEIDVFSCYLVNERLFFHIPRNEIADRRTIKLSAVPRSSMWAQFRENWGVFEIDLPSVELSP